MTENASRLGRRSTWLRGLCMLVFALAFAVAEAVLLLAAVLQFGWLLLSGRRNDHIAKFGEGLARWLSATARFQTAASEEKPFPWAPWGQ